MKSCSSIFYTDKEASKQVNSVEEVGRGGSVSAMEQEKGSVVGGPPSLVDFYWFDMKISFFHFGMVLMI